MPRMTTYQRENGRCPSWASYEIFFYSIALRNTHKLTPYPVRNTPQCPCSHHSDSADAQVPHPNNSSQGLRGASPKALTDANIAEHDRRPNPDPIPEDNRSSKAARLTMAARSLGINVRDIVKDRPEDMEGDLPMERFMADAKQSKLMKYMVGTKEEKKEHP